MMEALLIKLVLAGIVFFFVLNLAGFHTWVERKQSALIQDRIGANRASIFGFTMLPRSGRSRAAPSTSRSYQPSVPGRSRARSACPRNRIRGVMV